ncbi:MAG: TetR family transcriptional regulator [Ornithinimicrobium sp.]
MAAGRRVGAPDTKTEIVSAARAEFASKGYDGTSMRAVARAAGVDPALIHHYFDGKEGLFLAALEVPFDPRPELARVLVGPREEMGAKLVELVLWLWDDPERQELLLTLMRSALTTAEGTQLIKDGVLRTIMTEVASHIPMADPATHLPLVITQTGGLILTRYIVRLEPVASMPAEELVAIYGPIVQRFLDGEVG